MAAPSPANDAEPFGYCMNTSTIRGQNLPLPEVVDIIAKAGFGAIEPWIAEIERYQQGGGSLADMKKRIADHGLAVPSAIGFAEWIVDDDERRAKGIERMKHDMDLVAQIGGTRIAAPAAGLKGSDAPPSLDHMGERYRVVQDLGKQTGITPELELWGPSKALGKLADVLYVAAAAGGERPQLLLDIYHLHKGGSHLESLAMLRGEALPVIHANDYPDLPRDQLTDALRVFPGDGVAPLKELFHTLRDIGFRGFLSVELFNKDYWKQSPPKVAELALAKTREAVRKAFS
jgi:sugar phosphate isomerase/epimerase